MRAWIVPLVWACALVPLAACDGGDDGGGSGGAGGADGGGTGATGASGGSSGGGFSCHTPAKFSCLQMPIPQSNPGWQAAADQCTTDGGTPGTACPTADVLARCDGVQQTFYYTGYDSLTKAESVCTGLGGTWVVP